MTALTERAAGRFEERHDLAEGDIIPGQGVVRLIGLRLHAASGRHHASSAYIRGSKQTLMPVGEFAAAPPRARESASS